MDFYKRIDIAVVSGQKLDDSTIELQWQVSVVWPAFWAPQALITGSSTLTLEKDNDNFLCRRQVDVLDDSDLVGSIAKQVLPSFWDMYHIGMSPSCETMPRIEAKTKKSLTLRNKYSVFEIPSRIVSVPTMLDKISDRTVGNAQIVPNHSFSAVIKTVGFGMQRYVPTSPVQIQILSKKGKEGAVELKWSLPLAVEFQSYEKWVLPTMGEEDDDDDDDADDDLGDDDEFDTEPAFRYEFNGRRKVATIRYGGDPQDAEITEIRKQLYEDVVKDGLKPKVDESGRPQFFFLQNNVKAGYTENGLGMCVYEWRPQFVKCNEVGIELEV